ncbi:hypothetical protein AMTRI_Chr04g253260 [Amborella trichopoda]|uniref:Neprosin activation peptide domain-containing protein n=1 Tax=Amborella trichopoda TaxID=13333 RepID=W1NH36_AMBTC|nr:uncharacterized protein LOC18422268 [Amborella trichopoda]ERM94519.1 hypothetical protein AMTR_s00010p00263890 [Amborella trichopoda]|eukprot:XP_006827282.1 uncharacterized protein LOC18422268 [Amborella trichopoda]
MGTFNEKFLILLIFVLLGLSSLVSIKAIPLTRSLQMENHYLQSADDTNQLVTEEIGEEVINGRMDIECCDYPVSGANRRHTPRQPGGKR